MIVCDHPQIEIENAISNGCDCDFKIQNSGNRPLLISGVRFGCGSCISLVDSPRDPIVFGETQHIRLRVLPKKVVAGEVKKVTVFSNDPQSPRLTLQIRVKS